MDSARGTAVSQTAPLPAPPGETGVELTGGDAIAAMHEALKAITEVPRVSLQVGEIEAKKVGRWVILTVRYRRKNRKTPPEEVTVRISTIWARVLRDRLKRVVGE